MHIATEAWTLGVSKPMRVMGFEWFHWALFYQLGASAESKGHIKRTEENIGQAQ